MGAERRFSAAVVMALLCAPALAGAQTVPAADPASEPARRWRGPNTGFLAQGRIGTSIGGVGVLGGLGGLASLGGLGTSTALGAAVGYRGGSWSLAFAPSLASTSSPSSDTTRSKTLIFGLGVLVDRVLARAVDGRVELGFLAGASISRVSYDVAGRSDSGAAFGFLLGLSTRYWFSPAAAVGVEFGESYSNTPLLNLGTTAVPDSRSSAFSTFGTINLSVVFGG
ncbi:MAG: hypothetical protein JWM10_651 [Myxococcaceae bacterium]|nr:hypothetical protein [Myxococcaceae bacterium]